MSISLELRSLSTKFLQIATRSFQVVLKKYLVSKDKKYQIFPPPTCQGRLSRWIPQRSKNLMTLVGMFCKKIYRNKKDIQKNFFMSSQSRNALNGIKTCSVLHTYNAIVFRPSGHIHCISLLLTSPPLPKPMTILVFEIKFKILNTIH